MSNLKSPQLLIKLAFYKIQMFKEQIHFIMRPNAKADNINETNKVGME